MTRGKQHYFDKIIEKSPIKAYTATNTAMLEYPYVLGRIGESSPTLSEQAESYILDSGIGDDTTAEDVIEQAEEHDADIVVPCDVIDEPRETTEATVEMLMKVADTDVEVVLPLQSDETTGYVDHYHQQCDIIQSFGLDVPAKILVGGLRDRPIVNQIECVMKIRNELGKDAYIHALGCGIHKDWAVTIRQYPNLIDSLDTSSVVQNVRKGLIFDQRMELAEYMMPRGSCSTSLSTLMRELQLYLFNYVISDLIREEDAPSEPSDDVAELLEAYE